MTGINRRSGSTFWLVTAAFAALVWPSPADAADQLLIQKLAPEIAKRCIGGRIRAGALGEAIYASGVAPLKSEYAWLHGGPRLIAAQAFQGGSKDNQSSLRLWRRLIETWVDPSDPVAGRYLPFGSGGVSIARANGALLTSGDSQPVLRDILAGDDTQFQFTCTEGGRLPQAPKKPVEDRFKIAIARSPEQLVLPLDKKKYAEVAYVNNEVKDKSSTSIYGTVGFSWGEFTPIRREPQRPGLLVRVVPSAFVQLEREGLDDGDRDGEVNNLNFGGQVGGFFQTRGAVTRTHYYALSARYLTDLDFKSEAWSASLTLTPEIPIPGNDQPYDLIRDKLELEWLLAGVADHMNVVDPGDKTQLAEAPEFTRVGFNSSATLRFLLDDDRKQALAFITSYQLREALGGSKGNARMLSLKLLLEPAPQYAFGVSYDRGRNLDSLEFTKTWKVTLGIRR